MTGTQPTTPAGGYARDDLTARIFRALYQGFDLHRIGEAYLAVPKGTPCYAGPSLGDIARQISAASVTAPVPAPRGRHRQLSRLPAQPAPQDAARLASFLRRHPCWSAFWDKKYRVWRVAEDDPGSVLYAESPDASTVISYITGHTLACPADLAGDKAAGRRPAPPLTAADHKDPDAPNEPRFVPHGHVPGTRPGTQIP